MTLLTPSQASPIVGVPVVQLLRWAVLGQGPKNSGTKHKPMYAEEDLERWKEAPILVTVRGDCGAIHTSIEEWRACMICAQIADSRRRA